MESEDDEVQEMEGEQWNYLDGTPASRPDPVERPSGLVQTFSDIAGAINPLNWFRSKPVPGRMVMNQRNLRRPNPSRGNNLAQTTIRVPKSNANTGGEPAAKRRRPIDVPFGALNLDVCRENPPSGGMPPNVNVVVDERPPQGSISPSKYMTDDEDSDVEMIPGPAEEAERKKRINRQFQKSDDQSTASSSSTFKRAPLAERRDISSPATSSQRRVTLPAVVTPTRVSQQPPHQLAEQVKSPATASKKRGFTEVDKEDVMPPLFTNFPRALDRKTTGLLPVSRFAYSRPGQDALSAMSPKLSPVMNKLTKTNSGRSSPLSVGFRVLPTPTRNQNSPQQKPVNRSAVKLSGLDYSYIVPANPYLPGDGEEFTFHSAIYVPNGVLARDIDVSGLLMNDTAEPIIATQRCRKCGITLRNGERGCSVCDRARNSPESGQNLSKGTENVRENARKGSAETENSSSASEKWICDACREENPANVSSCRTCFKSRPAVKEMQPSRQPAPEESAKRSRGNEGSSESDSGWKRPTESESASTSKQSGSAEGVDKSSQGSSAESKKAEIAAPTGGTTAASASTSEAPTGLVDLWANAAKKIKNGWSCSVCMVDNPEGTVVCSCCSTPKPGAKPPPALETAPTWTFGGQQPAVSPPKVDESKSLQPSTGGFSFSFGGAAASTTASAPGAFSGFSFGTPASQPAQALAAATTFGSQPITNGPSGLAAAKPAEAAAPSSAPSSLGTTKAPVTMTFPGFVMPAAASDEAPKANGLPAPESTNSALPSGPPSSMFGFSAAPAFPKAPTVPTNFTFGAPGSFAGFGAPQTSQTSSGGFGLGSSAFPSAAPPASTATAGPAAPFAFGQPKIDAASFQFGQPVQNGQSGASAAAAPPSFMGGLNSAPQPSPSVLNMLGGVPTMASAVPPAANARRFIKAKRTIQR